MENLFQPAEVYEAKFIGEPKQLVDNSTGEGGVSSGDNPDPKPVQASPMGRYQVSAVAGLRYIYEPPIETIRVLGAVKPKEVAKERCPEDLYVRLKYNPLTLVAIERAGVEYQEIFALGAPLDGAKLNNLLLSVAPGKDYRLDTNDIKTDWDRMLRPQDTVMVKRLERHAQMGLPWDVFMRDCEFFRNLILRDVMGESQATEAEPQALVVPAAHWLSDGENRLFVLDLLEDPEFDWLKNYYINLHPKQEGALQASQSFNPSVGVWMVGHFSPSIKNRKDLWPERQTYGPNCVGTQYISPTQAGVAALRASDSLLASSFLANVENYLAEHGEALDWATIS